MVHGDEAVLFVVPLQQRELGHPEEVVLRLVDQVELPAQGETHLAQRRAGDVRPVGGEEERVAGLGVHGLLEGLEPVFLHELGEAGLDRPVGRDGQPGKTLDVIRFRQLAQRVDFLAGKMRGHALGVQAAHAYGVIEHAEAALAGHFGHILQLHAETGVRLVAAVIVHRLPPGHAGQRQLDVDILHGLEDLRKRAFHDGLDIFRLNEAHFDIELRELGLTVGAAVLVAEAAGHLIILVKTGQHQKLLVNLRALGQGVELAGPHAAGHEVIARALGRGLREDRRFHLGEAAFVHVTADRREHLCAHAQVLLHAGLAQVEVAVLEANEFVLIGVVVDVDGRRGRSIEERRLFRDHFDLAGLELVGYVLFGAQRHFARDRHNVLAAQALAHGEGFRVAGFGAEDDLHKTRAVAQPDEDHAAEVAGALHPAVQRDLLSGEAFRKFAAILRALPFLACHIRFSPSCIPPRFPAGFRFLPSFACCAA